MANWQEILDSFKSQFETVGPEKFVQSGGSLDTSFELADKMMSTLAHGANQATSIMATNKREEIAAAEAAKKQGYKRVYNKTGGYDFFDPNGNKISPLEWSMAKGVSIADAFQGSYNKDDLEFLDEYNIMQEDLANKDMDFNKAIDLMSQNYPSIFGRQGDAVENAYMTASQTVRKQNVAETYGNVESNDRVDKVIIDFANKAQSFNNREEATMEINKVINGLGGKWYKFQRGFDDTEQKKIKEYLSAITDEIFPSNTKENRMRNLPF